VRRLGRMKKLALVAVEFAVLFALLYFQHAGAALAPDVVVMQFAWNDVQDTLTHGGFRLTPTGVELRADVRDPPFWRDRLLLAAETRGEATFLAGDGHLSPAGHRVVAAALAAAVLRYDGAS